MQHIAFLILSVLSHIGASLFFAKPRFNKLIIAAIWIAYGAIFILLQPETPSEIKSEMQPANYFVSFLLHLVLFFITTKGRNVEKGFLFFSYATTYTCFNVLFILMNNTIENAAVKIRLCLSLMVIMQFILYQLLLPSFRKVANHFIKGWGKYYGVVLSFWALIVGQLLFAMANPMGVRECIIFLLTMVAFCVTYVTIFNSMKNMVQLSHEKQKSLHAELLQAQVDAQAKEARLVYQNRHDMRFHYQALMTLAKEGETDKIIDYLNLQSKSLDSTTTGRFCENETINNILKVFYRKATAQKITMEIRAAAKPDISVPPPALVTVIANILENAIHGAIESKAEKPSITISVKHKSGHLVISCENSCISTLRFDEMPEYLQGIGVHSVISTSEKYNGSCRFSAGDGIFSVTVIMDE